MLAVGKITNEVPSCSDMEPTQAGSHGNSAVLQLLCSEHENFFPSLVLAQASWVPVVFWEGSASSSDAVLRASFWCLVCLVGRKIRHDVLNVNVHVWHARSCLHPVWLVIRFGAQW